MYKLKDGDYLRVGNCIYRFLAGGNVEAQYHEEIYRMTIMDGLTGVHNKRYFLETLDKRLGQVPAAAIQLKAGSDEPSIAELDAHLRQHVYATHIPTMWKLVEAIPKNKSLKTDAAAVRELFAT